MIFGVGCDLCEISRIEKTDERFLNRCFTEKERELFKKKHNAAQTIAANFAVKEAFSKAVGTGMREFFFNDIEVLRDELGKPYINLYGGAREKCEELKISAGFVSISHTKELAMAYVVLEKENL